MPRRNYNARGRKRKTKKKAFPKTKKDEPDLIKNVASTEITTNIDQENPFKRKSLFTSIVLMESEQHEQQIRLGFEKAFAGSWRDDPEKVKRVDELRRQAQNKGLQPEPLGK